MEDNFEGINTFFTWKRFVWHEIEKKTLNRKCYPITCMTLTFGLNLGGRPKWRIQFNLAPRRRMTSASCKALKVWRKVMSPRNENEGATYVGYDNVCFAYIILCSLVW